MKPLNERRLDAEVRAGKWLADGNAHNERGDKKKADFCYAKSQYWLDRANRLIEMHFGG